MNNKEKKPTDMNRKCKVATTVNEFLECIINMLNC